MQFIKKHYDKVILSAVLVVLLVVAVLLPLDVSSFESELQEIRQSTAGAPPIPFAPTDISTNKALLNRFASPKGPELTREHRLFNPGPWRRTSDGAIVKSEAGGGLDALRLTNITELKLKVELGPVDTTLSRPTYRVQITNPDARQSQKIEPHQLGETVSRNNWFVIQRAEGSEVDPSLTGLLRVPNRPEEAITFSKSKPFERTIGYAADFFYPPSQSIRLVKKGMDLPPSVRAQGDTETYTVTSVSATDATVRAKQSNVGRTIPLTAPNAGRP